MITNIYCLLSCKDTNLKAIHNNVSLNVCKLSIVFYLAKILIWKQFTTGLEEVHTYSYCLLSCKDTNLKAIHNYRKWGQRENPIVFYLAKILIWKQFTTCTRVYVPKSYCLLSCKDTNLKAIHNVQLYRQSMRRIVFYLAKILIWKQFTTYSCTGRACVELSSILQRY